MLCRGLLRNSLFLLFTLLWSSTPPYSGQLSSASEHIPHMPKHLAASAPVELNSLHFFLLILWFFHLRESFHNSNIIFFSIIEFILKKLLSITDLYGMDCGVLLFIMNTSDIYGTKKKKKKLQHKYISLCVSSSQKYLCMLSQSFVVYRQVPHKCTYPIYTMELLRFCL